MVAEPLARSHFPHGGPYNMSLNPGFGLYIPNILSSVACSYHAMTLTWTPSIFASEGSPMIVGPTDSDLRCSLRIYCNISGRMIRGALPLFHTPPDGREPHPDMACE